MNGIDSIFKARTVKTPEWEHTELCRIETSRPTEHALFCTSMHLGIVHRGWMNKTVRVALDNTSNCIENQLVYVRILQ